MIPDLERVVSDYLRDHNAVEALTTRIVGKTPTDDSGGTHVSWVQVTMLAAPDRTGGAPDHLIGFLLQFDCYAGINGGQPEATLIGRTVRHALREMPGAAADAIVSQVTITGHIRLPDNEFKPTRQRVVLTAEIRAHA